MPVAGSSNYGRLKYGIKATLGHRSVPRTIDVYPPDNGAKNHLEVEKLQDDLMAA